ncbi:MAG: hypothetical protein B6226_02880 [Candidatus Cloacimonetes bacterium 4572_65]|nr:MAG: hypothetical protein B6226_02880 [Candidatus Cloacimonetes bacterium 4572_65]
MLYLILAVISSVTIGHLLNFYKRRERKVPILQIFLGNYFVASLVSFYFAYPLETKPNLLDLGLGFIFGTLFLVNFLIFQENIFKNGMSMSVSVMRLSLVIPVVLSIIFFNESLPIVNYIGVFIVIVAFVFMGKSGGVKSIWWILLLFFTTGVTESGMKLFDEIATSSNNQMLFYLFSFAFFVNLALIIYKKQSLKWKYIAEGLVLGIPNQLTSFFFLKGLITVEAAVAYPFVSSNVVLLGFITDKLIWKSKFSKSQYIVFGLILIGVILLNIR